MPIRQKEMSESEQGAEREKLQRLAKARPQKVVITDIKIPFTSWVGLLVTVAIASIPAAIIVTIIIWVVIVILGALAR